MTTIAFDGHRMAADTLTADRFGLKLAAHKIYRGPDYLVGGSGAIGSVVRWWNGVGMYWGIEQVVRHGYPEWSETADNPCLLLAGHGGIWEHSQGAFLPVSRPYHAIGSGRDFALAAMRLGRTAQQAVILAQEFDVNTGGDVDVETVPVHNTDLEI